LRPFFPCRPSHPFVGVRDVVEADLSEMAVLERNKYLYS